MKSKSEMKCLYFCVKTGIFIKNNSFFCNQTGKVLKIYSFYLSCCIIQLTYILSSLLIKPAKIFSFFASKTDIFIFGYILGNTCDVPGESGPDSKFPYRMNSSRHTALVQRKHSVMTLRRR